MKRFKRFLKRNQWVFIVLADGAMLAMLLYMLFGWMSAEVWIYVLQNLAG